MSIHGTIKPYKTRVEELKEEIDRYSRHCRFMLSELERMIEAYIDQIPVFGVDEWDVEWQDANLVEYKNRAYGELIHWIASKGDEDAEVEKRAKKFESAVIDICRLTKYPWLRDWIGTNMKVEYIMLVKHEKDQAACMSDV